MLSISGLTVDYGSVRAIDDLTLEVPRGEVTAVIGANGAGKSTLLRTLAGLVKPTSGSATLDGAELIGKRPEDVVRSGLSLVPEGRSTVPELTVDENLRLGGLWHSRTDRSARQAEVYELFPVLADRSHMRADTLSGGERQQLAIGRALMSGPECLLLDEPSLGLAPLIAQQIFDIVRELNTKHGLTVFLVEQNAYHALKLAHRGYVMVNGAITMSGSGRDLLERPEVRAAYLEGGRSQ